MDTTRPPREKSSTWIYVGCGCALLVGLLLAGFAGLVLIGYRQAKGFERAFKDPATRLAKTREILPWDELPAGYHPLGAFSIPMVMDVALLSDVEPPPGAPEDHAFKDHGFIYMVLRDWVGKRRELERFLKGEGKKPDWMQKTDMDLRKQEVLRRGELTVEGRPVLFAASRGEVVRRGKRKQGLVTLLTVDCPHDDRLRLGFWFNPDPAPGTPPEDLDLAGTGADPAAIRGFLSHFHLCPAAR